MSQQVFTLTTSSPNLPATPLGFAARSVTVDNYTSSYCNITDTGLTIPPWVTGSVIALPDGITNARASLTATTPAVPGPPVPTQQATLTWTDIALPSSAGHLLSSLSTSPAVFLGTVTAPGGGGQTSQTFSLPSGTLAVGLIIDFSGGNPAQIRFDGGVTAETYLSINNPSSLPGSGPYTALIGAPVETSVIVRITSQAQTDIVHVVAYLSQVNVVAQQLPGTSYSVTQASASPAPWQAATKTIRFASAGLTAGQANAITLVSAVAAQSVYLYSVTFCIDVAVANCGVHLDGKSSGGNEFRGDFRASTTNSQMIHGWGAPGTSGNGLFLWSDVNTGQFAGAVSYTQA